jgi:hypothetical protein
VADDLGPWSPLSVPETAAVMHGCGAPWWIGGGWAIELLVGRPTRVHSDVDVLVLRRDLASIRAHLAAWDVHAADPPGSLRPWALDETLPADVHDIFLRRTPTSPWCFQLMIDDTDGDDWLFRRDHGIRRPVSSLTGRASTASLGVLAPEIQLLYKSRGLRPRDEADFDVALPHLVDVEREWLADALTRVSPDHPWLTRF